MHIEASYRALLALLLLQRCDFWPLHFPHKTLLPSHKNKIKQNQDVGEFYLPKLELTHLWYSLEDLVWVISDVLVLSIYQILCYTVAKLRLVTCVCISSQVSLERILSESASERHWTIQNQESVYNSCNNLQDQIQGYMKKVMSAWQKIEVGLGKWLHLVS